LTSICGEAATHGSIGEPNSTVPFQGCSGARMLSEPVVFDWSP
jgi:hypothetical protein